MEQNRYNIISRVMSFLLLSIPLAFAAQEAAKSELNIYETYSHEQLLIFLKSVWAEGFMANWFSVLSLGGILYCTVELVAYAIRSLLTHFYQ